VKELELSERDRMDIIIRPRLIREAIKLLVKNCGAGGFALAFSLGYEYGRLVTKHDIRDYDLEKVIKTVRNYVGIDLKLRENGKVIYVKGKDPFINGFLCGIFSLVYRKFTIRYIEDHTIICFTNT